MELLSTFLSHHRRKYWAKEKLKFFKWGKNVNIEENLKGGNLNFLHKKKSWCNYWNMLAQRERNAKRLFGIKNVITLELLLSLEVDTVGQNLIDVSLMYKISFSQLLLMFLTYWLEKFATTIAKATAMIFIMMDKKLSEFSS